MSDHWNNLANLIGADVPKEPTTKDPTSPRADEDFTPDPPKDEDGDSLIEASEPPSTSQEQAPEARKSPARASSETESTKGPPPETPKPRNHWQKVAGALGLSFGKSDQKPIEPLEAESTIAEANEVPLGNVDDQIVVEREPDEPKLDTAKSDTAKSDTAKSDTAKSDTAKSDLPVAEEKPSMFGFGWKSKSVDTAASPPASASPADKTPDVDALFGETTGDSEPEETYDKKHAERELAALFSEPVDTSIDGLEFTPAEHAYPEEDSKPRYVDDINVDDINVDDIPFDEPVDPESAQTRDPDADEEESRRGRRRRRGGRRRRRGDKQQPTADDRSDVEQVQSTSGDSDPTSPPEIPAPTGAFGSGIMDQVESMPLEEDVAPSESGSEDRRSRRFRNIRSWKDTISTIVDANLAARGNSPAPRGSNGGGGRRRRGGGGKRSSGRGRSRRSSGGGAKPDGGNDS